MAKGKLNWLTPRQARREENILDAINTIYKIQIHLTRSRKAAKKPF